MRPLKALVESNSLMVETIDRLPREHFDLALRLNDQIGENTEACSMIISHSAEMDCDICDEPMPGDRLFTCISGAFLLLAMYGLYEMIRNLI